MSLKINNIFFSYDKFSLSVDMEIKSGEFVSVLGPSGSGKTTLLRLLAGFQAPESGQIVLSGRDITKVQTSARNIGMVFQDYALFPHFNVFNNIAYGLKNKKADNKEIKSSVSRLLELVSLEGYEKRKINELSGGEKQRVALARAIAPEPELLLFDEPLSALDVKLRKGLRREIKKIQKQLGFTAVYVTHDQDEAMSVSDRIALMNKGKIIQFGAPEELYNKPADFFTADFIGVMNRINNGKELMFRPESCKILHQDEPHDPADIIINVVVEICEYSGGYYICEAVTEQKETITLYSDKKMETGTRLVALINEKELIKCF